MSTEISLEFHRYRKRDFSLKKFRDSPTSNVELVQTSSITNTEAVEVQQSELHDIRFTGSSMKVEVRGVTYAPETIYNGN